MKLRQLVIAASLGLTLAGSASANPSFPYFFEQAGVPEPPCTVCHRDDAGGKGTVNKPFGVSMMRLGLNSESTGGDIQAAIAASEAQGIDSDGDGVSDIEELRTGQDPNDNPNPDAGDGVAVTSEFPLPQTGCAMQRPGAASDTWMLFLLSFAAVLLARRSRKFQESKARSPIPEGLSAHAAGRGESLAPRRAGKRPLS